MKHHEALMPQIIPANICKISIVSSFAQLARFSWPNSRSQAEKWGVIVLIWKNLKSLACISSGAHELLDLAKTGLLSPGTSLRAVSGCLFAKNLFYSKPFFFCEDSFLRVGNFEVKYFFMFFESFLPTSQIGRWHVVDKVRRIRQRLHKKLGGVLSKSEFSDAMECFKILEAQLVWKNEDEHDDLLHHQAVTASLVHVVIHVVALCCLCCFADIWGSAPRMKR